MLACKVLRSSVESKIAVCRSNRGACCHAPAVNARGVPHRRWILLRLQAKKKGRLQQRRPSLLVEEPSDSLGTQIRYGDCWFSSVTAVTKHTLKICIGTRVGHWRVKFL